jgi:hypothetical protein
MLKAPRMRGLLRGVSDGTRTRGHLDHNQELYQLSYAHQVPRQCRRLKCGEVRSLYAIAPEEEQRPHG